MPEWRGISSLIRRRLDEAFGIRAPRSARAPVRGLAEGNAGGPYEACTGMSPRGEGRRAVLGRRRDVPNAEVRVYPNVDPVGVGRTPGAAVGAGDLRFIRCSLTLRVSEEQRQLEWPRLTSGISGERSESAACRG